MIPMIEERSCEIRKCSMRTLMWDKEYLIVLIGCYQSNIEHHPITQMIFFYIEFCGYSG